MLYLRMYVCTYVCVHACACIVYVCTCLCTCMHTGKYTHMPLAHACRDCLVWLLRQVHGGCHVCIL